jgi:Mg2+/citrate symporter
LEESFTNSYSRHDIAEILLTLALNINQSINQSNSYYFVLVGPIVSGLVNQFGCRKVTVAGSIVAAAGFIIGSFSPNLDVLILTYGVIGGMEPW